MSHGVYEGVSADDLLAELYPTDNLEAEFDDGDAAFLEFVEKRDSSSAAISNQLVRDLFSGR